MSSGSKDSWERALEEEIEEKKRIAEEHNKKVVLERLLGGAVDHNIDLEEVPEQFIFRMMLAYQMSREHALILSSINLKTERKIKRIVVHAAETYPDMDVGADWIRNIHINENKWRDIGYHLVIRRNGLPEVGRPIHQIGAHTLGFNNDSIGICLAGGKARPGKSASNYTFTELMTLHALLSLLTNEYPDAEVCGHHDLAPGRGCPLFDVKSFWYGE